MPYPNDRRKHQAEADEVLSPEYLAMLIACGGEVRAADHDAAGERPRSSATADARTICRCRTGSAPIAELNRCAEPHPGCASQQR